MAEINSGNINQKTQKYFQSFSYGGKGLLHVSVFSREERVLKVLLEKFKFAEEDLEFLFRAVCNMHDWQIAECLRQNAIDNNILNESIGSLCGRR